jgi:hypothetical protein
VNAASDCVWQVTSNAAWIQVDSGTLGVGQGNVSYSVLANGNKSPRTGTITVGGQTFTITQLGGSSPTRVGTYQSGAWQLDVNGTGAFENSGDKSFFLGFPGATQVLGDWNGDGRTKAGVYANGYWYLDYDGNGIWDGGAVDKLIA